jgi:hypothetical protein
MKMTMKQMEVMRLLHDGQQPYTHAGASVHVNGQRLCNVSTMKVLERKGLAEMVTRFQWRITRAGTEFMEGR